MAWFNDAEVKGAITIAGFKLLDDQGRECGMFDYGQRMRIRIEYDATREIIEPDFRVGIDRVDNVHCMTYSSVSDKVDIPSVVGKGVIELRTPPLLLVSDLYNINLSVREKGFGRTLTAQRGDSFHVRHPLYTAGFGVYHEPAQWAVPSPVQHPIPLTANERG